MSILEYEYLGITFLDVLIIFFVVVLAVFAGKALSIYLSRYLKKRMTRDHIKLISKSIYFVFFFIALLIILPIIGIKASSLALAGGMFAIVIGFATQSIFGNLVSGIFLIFERPIKLGDVVDIDGTVGQVEDIRIISTTLRTFDGYFIRIPNMTVFNGKITNYFVNKVRRFEYVVGIRYKDDADKALKVIKETIEKNPFALKYPEPVIFVDKLGNSSVDISVKIWAPFTEWYDVRKDLLWKIKTNLEKNHIIVPFPQREVWFNSDLKLNKEDSMIKSMDVGIEN